MAKSHSTAESPQARRKGCRTEQTDVQATVRARRQLEVEVEAGAGRPADRIHCSSPGFTAPTQEWREGTQGLCSGDGAPAYSPRAKELGKRDTDLLAAPQHPLAADRRFGSCIQERH